MHKERGNSFKRRLHDGSVGQARSNRRKFRTFPSTAHAQHLTVRAVPARRRATQYGAGNPEHPRICTPDCDRCGCATRKQRCLESKRQPIQSTGLIALDLRTPHAPLPTPAAPMHSNKTLRNETNMRPGKSTIMVPMLLLNNDVFGLQCAILPARCGGSGDRSVEIERLVVQRLQRRMEFHHHTGERCGPCRGKTAMLATAALAAASVQLP